MIEIVKGEDNPVSKFFSTKHNTTEIDVKELEKRCDALERAMSYSSKSNTLLSKFLQAIKERNEARDMVEKLTEQGLAMMDENRMLKRQIKKIKNTIRETLEENRHLADGDDCTLRKLKQLVRDNSHDKVSRDGVSE